MLSIPTLFASRTDSTAAAAELVGGRAVIGDYVGKSTAVVVGFDVVDVAVEGFAVLSATMAAVDGVAYWSCLMWLSMLDCLWVFEWEMLWDLHNHQRCLAITCRLVWPVAVTTGLHQLVFQQHMHGCPCLRHQDNSYMYAQQLSVEYNPVVPDGMPDKMEW